MSEKKIFDCNLNWSKESVELGMEVDKALAPIMEKWVDAGHLVHEISYVMLMEISMLDAKTRLFKRAEMKKSSEESDDKV